MIMGIQGGRGSTNEQAALIFAEQLELKDYVIQYLITTKSVLEALKNGAIDRGVFAYRSTAGLVGETQDAFEALGTDWWKKRSAMRVPLDHALLASDAIDTSQTVNIYSHPQALLEHGDFLRDRFGDIELIPAKDTAGAAQDLSEGKYPKNALVIAPILCAEIYGLEVIESDLPSNAGYETEFWLVESV